MVRIGIVGEYDSAWESHTATNAAIEHSCDALSVDANYEWVSTSDLDRTFFDRYSAVWVAPGSPYKNLSNTIDIIRIARETGVPTLGTCGGFQHMIIEYARNLLGIADAQHAEYDPYSSCLFISELECSLAGKEMEVVLDAKSMAATLYGDTHVVEQYYCNFGVNPVYLEQLKSGLLCFSGFDADGEVRIIEHPRHAFYLGTLFVPQIRSKPGQPHPIVNAFVAECARFCS